MPYISFWEHRIFEESDFWWCFLYLFGASQSEKCRFSQPPGFYGSPGGSHRGATGEPPGTSGKVRSLYRRGLGRFVYVYLYILELIGVFIYLIYITLCYSLFEKSIKQDSNTLDRSERVGGFRRFLHRVMVIFRQQKNFGPNVIYFVLGTYIENQQMRIQEGRFLKIALNLVLTLPDDGECLALLISCGIIDLGAFCVELW